MDEDDSDFEIRDSDEEEALGGPGKKRKKHSDVKGKRKTRGQIDRKAARSFAAVLEDAGGVNPDEVEAGEGGSGLTLGNGSLTEGGTTGNAQTIPGKLTTSGAAAAQENSAAAAAAAYIAAAAGPARFSRGKKICSICGSIARYECIRCGARYCNKRCSITHTDTRCMKTV